MVKYGNRFFYMMPKQNPYFPYMSPHDFSRAKTLFIDGFYEFKVNRIEANVVPQNLPSQNLLIRNGMEVYNSLIMHQKHTNPLISELVDLYSNAYIFLVTSYFTFKKVVKKGLVD